MDMVDSMGNILGKVDNMGGYMRMVLKEHLLIHLIGMAQQNHHRLLYDHLDYGNYHHRVFDIDNCYYTYLYSFHNIL